MSLTDRKKQLEEQRAALAEGPDKQPVKTRHTFTVKVRNPQTGAIELEGVFTSKIPTIKDRGTIGQLCAQFAAPVRFDDLPVETRMLYTAMARCAVCLVQRPEWFDRVEDLNNEQVLESVYLTMLAHENEFFRAVPGGDDGEKPGTSKLLVEVAPLVGRAIPESGDSWKPPVGQRG